MPDELASWLSLRLWFDVNSLSALKTRLGQFTFGLGIRVFTSGTWLRSALLWSEVDETTMELIPTYRII